MWWPNSILEKLFDIESRGVVSKPRVTTTIGDEAAVRDSDGVAGKAMLSEVGSGDHRRLGCSGSRIPVSLLSHLWQFGLNVPIDDPSQLPEGVITGLGRLASRPEDLSALFG